ncbi:MAG: pyrroline-5-carboxylate reductase [Treponema sp.]|jgi:pyrroline-5-carboxylate reductase|nr:pyrroline-5-carboxylate reductase [Treponema sp.]
MSLNNSKVVCIGIGSMGGAIIKSICKKFPSKNIYITRRNQELGQKLANEMNCNFVSSNKEIVQDANYIFLAVKPNMISSVLSEIKDFVPPNAVLISMAAGMKIAKLNEFAPNLRFIRIMPNVPSQISEGMIAVSYNENITTEEASEVTELLQSTGIVEKVDEKLMDCVTAVSGSSPAFVFIFIEALADAAVRCGMPRKQAYLYAAQTVKGSASLVLKTGKNPAELKDSVCSPGGTTIEGVSALEQNGFRYSIIDAVTKAYEKSVSLGK